MPTQAATALDRDYRALTEGAGVLERADRAHLTVRGPDAAEYLQGQVTNDVESLQPGAGLYAAMLNPKGRILADARILRITADDVWLDTEGVAREAAHRELVTYKIGRRVEVLDATGERTVLSLAGPRAWEVIVAAGLVAGSAPDGEHSWTRAVDGTPIVATDTGFDLLTEQGATASKRAAILDAGAVEVSAEAAEIVRIERGRPRYGTDMDAGNLPAEAGIVERAVSFTKGCYVGQEPVARMFHKGHPNRHLRGLELSAPVSPGSVASAGDREVGTATSTAVSPARGPIALAILRREVEPGDEVTAAPGVVARVVELPF